MIDAAARKAAATELDTTFFVEAAAGTGKTTALVSRILEAIKTGRARLHEIVAITFTEKAAGELKIKLREKLEEQLTGDNLRQALGDLERANITTIHAFCASVLRERPVEAAVDPQFAVADELQRELLLDEAWSTWLEGELSANPTALRQALFREVRVDELQAMATMLVHNRARLATANWPAPVPVKVDEVLEKLAAYTGPLESSLQHCLDKAGNFHHRIRILCDTLPELRHASEERAAAMLSSLELTQPLRKADFDSEEAFREAKRLVKEAKDILEEFADAVDHNYLVNLVAWLQGFTLHFQRVKFAEAMLDFDDLLEKTRDLLRDNADVRRQLQERYKFLLVDEFQDTDPVQSELVLALAGSRPGKLFIVGDPKQSIYGFRRADIEMYAGTRRAIEKKGRVLKFQQNFRSKSTILDWVNETFKPLMKKPADGDYQPEYVELEPKEEYKTNEPRVTLLKPAIFPAKQSVDDARRAEAEAIAQFLRQQVDGGRMEWGDVALLFRSFTGVEIFADVFVEQGVPFRVVGGKGYYQRQEIETLIALLCCLDNPNDALHLVAVLRSPLFGWTDEQIFLAATADKLNYLRHEALAILRELHEQRHALSVAAYVELVFARTHICQAFVVVGPDGTSGIANLLKALDLARQLEAAGIHSLRGFVRQLRRTLVEGLDEEPAPATEDSQAVQLMTMHKSKGLEFKVVVLADLAGQSSDRGARLVLDRTAGTHELRFAKCRTSGFDTAVMEQDKRETAEEIRLLYVAATRARERLIIPWFKEKGERLDLLGIKPVASNLIEVPDLVGNSPSRPPASKLIAATKLVASRRQWQSKRAALLARAAQPVTRTSPSKLAHESEPREEEPTGLLRERAMELGTVVHEALERMDTGELPETARVMVERALKSELLQRAGKADEVYRELPFSTATLDGKIDLLFRKGKRWTLVDYKTDARPDVERYRPQMRAYCDALEKVADIKVDEVLLWFLATGQEVKL